VSSQKPSRTPDLRVLSWTSSILTAGFAHFYGWKTAFSVMLSHRHNKKARYFSRFILGVPGRLAWFA
jgi:hypothetical protein